VSEALLKVEHLTMRFGGLVAVNGLSFTVGRGDITALIGPNGAGKTTVFNCITGFYKPSEGRIALAHGDAAIWDELDALTFRDARSLARGGDALFLLERMPDYLVARRARVARTFQNIRLFPGMTVLENLLVAQHNPLMRASGYTVLGMFGLAHYGRAERGAIDKARHWLALTGLIARADDPAGALPYGARHVHRSGAALPRRARGRPQSSRKRRAQHADPNDPRRPQGLGAPDRARHERGDEHR
jgi:branched-chain amino acid transport system ATP-binding protein